MMKVANSRVIGRLTVRSFRANRLRNLFAVLAIALTSILFTTLFTLGMGIVETMQAETMRTAGGSAHGTFKYLSQQEYDTLKKHPLIKEIACNRIVEAADNEVFLKRRAELWYSDPAGMRIRFNTPTTGRMPQAENEAVTDTITLDMLGIPHKLGEKIPVTYTLKGIRHTEEFTLSGFYEGDPAAGAGIINVSKAYFDKIFADIPITFRADKDIAGVICADVMFENSLNIEENLKTVIRESGYSTDENAPDGIVYGVNWAYLSTGVQFDAGTVVSVLFAALLIVFTGYLIIYNVFQISVIKDIRFYGLLKTIGTTPRQLRRIITRQALLLSVFGIPIGLCAGFLVGQALLPLVVLASSYSRATVTPQPLIFVGAALFSLLTVFISCLKPGRMAASVSPVEAVRFSGVQGSIRRKAVKPQQGGRLLRMALRGLSRSKYRTGLVVVSMSLSLILLNSVFGLSQGFDMDKYLAKFVKSDFLLGHANYFNNNRMCFKEDALSEDFIAAASAQPGVIDGGRLYYNVNLARSTIRFTGDASLRPQQGMGEEQPLQLFGLEDYPLSRLEVVDGSLDMEKLKTGRYIIEGISVDDYGNVSLQEAVYPVGDKVQCTIEGKVYEYEVLAICKMDYSNYVRYYVGFNFYLPAQEYLKVISDPLVMSYQMDVDDAHIPAVEAFLKQYTTVIEPNMNYESKQQFANQFEGMRTMLLTVGGALSLIIGLIGILNFANATLTGIIARRQEFAMLQSMGLTSAQLYRLLIYEGLFYALATIGVSLVLGIAFSLGIIKGVVGSLWFFSYRFTLLPLLLAYPVLILLSAVIPYLACLGTNRQSIVERLREAE